MNSRITDLISRVIAALVLFLFVALSPSESAAQDSLYVNLLGQYDIPGTAVGVAVQGNYAYVVAENPDSLFIIDISDPSNPFQVGSFHEKEVKDIDVNGNYAYTVGDSLGIKDISDPANSIRLGSSYITQGYGVFISGSVAYVTRSSGNDFLSVYNVGDPDNPDYLGGVVLFYETGFGVYAQGGYAYVANGDSGLRIIDASDPNNPAHTGIYDTPGFAEGVFFMPGDHAFVADGASGLRIIDVSVPENPVEVGFYNTLGVTNEVEVDGNFAYLADDFLGMRVIYVKDLTNPVELGYYDPGGQAEDIVFANNLIYVADQSKGLLIFRKRMVVASLPEESFSSSTIPLTVSDLTGLDITAIQFVITYDSTLIDTGANVLFDSTSVLWGTNWSVEFNPSTPGSLAVALIGTDELTGADTLLNMILKGADGAPRGAHAEVEFREFIFNEGDPLGIAEPVTVILGFPYGDVSGNGRIMAYDASLAFQHRLGVIVLDEQQQVKADVDGDGDIDEFDVSLILQFVVTLIDSFPVEYTTPPLFPAEGTLELSEISAMPGETVTLPVELVDGAGIVSGSFTVEYDSDKLIFLGVENTSIIENYLVGKIEEEGAVSILFAGADVVEGDGQLLQLAFEVVESTVGATLLRMTDIHFNAEPMLAVGDSAFVHVNPTGVTQEKEGEIPAAFTLEQNHPNPFNPQTVISYALPQNAEVKLNIYNLRGELAAVLFEGPQSAGYYLVEWDGIGETGQMVASGIYFYRLQAGDFVQTRKMLFIR